MRALRGLLPVLGLLSLSVSVFLGKSWETSLQALDSTTHALISLEASKGGSGPRMPMQNLETNLRPDARFNDHPFPLFYLNGKVMRWFGPDAWSARLLPTLFSVGCILLTAWLGTLLFSFPVGLIGGLITLMSRDFVLIGSRFHLDTPMIFFILLSFILWVRKRPWSAGLAAGLGIWMKSPVSLLLFPSAGITLLFLRKLDRKALGNLALSSLIAVTTGALVWVLTGLLGGFDLVSDYWTRQVFGTAVGGRGTGGTTDHWLGLALLKRNYQPWFWLLLIAIGRIFYRRLWKKEGILLLLSATIVLELVMSVIRFKHYWYFLPVFPFLGLLCVAPFEAGLARIRPFLENSITGLGIVIPMLLISLPISLGPEDHPGLRKLSPFIQAYGTCADRILYIDGEQPFGSDLNSTYELAFYTGRKILQAGCDHAMDLLKRESPEWIVVTGMNRMRCLAPEITLQYPVEWNFGGQFLLSRKVPEEKQGDLTPLVRELKPPLDCVSIPLPDHPYFPKPLPKTQKGSEHD
jgi:4-amino-4-deoxy-L-arabinose transferase-like glycosyltransferase